MELGSTPADRPRPVGRGPKMHAAVLAATVAELAEGGYAALTVERVAQRAGVHKTTVYRRWKDRAALVVDALAEHIATDIPMPDTGSIGGDLREMARSLVGWLVSPTGRAVEAALISDAVRLPEIAEARARIFGDRFRRAEPVVARAVARGELPVGTDPSAVVSALAAPIHFRLLVSGGPLDDTVAEQAARITLAAARAGVLDTPARVAGPVDKG
ncbi:TetR/AcrR family transcriptional regulator [Streptomyces sp. N2-109]|uniref:TetR/AcrR family transcriptional regulator n=1 Tax=Streptomyces gossypii TaxID=2883101 RepID=A0ABT2K172_9ACTN|nr:TetR/AcrR family transcriptional regulator [Streptomyces gossypii]MCT2593214.1 TetR/AcrR family transcriptional regulator [Streptomyces gossypii]